MAYLLLLSRVLVLGLERPAFKQLSKDRSPLAATAIAYGIALLILLLLLAINPFPEQANGLSMQWLPYALASGVVAIAGYLLYTKSLADGEVSLVAPVYSLGLIFIYVLDLIFGKAVFSWLALLGILLVTFGIAALEGTSGLFSRSGMLRVMGRPGALYMVACALALGTTRVIDSLTISKAPEILYALVATVPTVLFCFAWLAWSRKLREVGSLLRERPLEGLVAATTHIGGYLLLLACLRHFDPSVVEPVSQLATLISVVAGALFFAERIRQRVIPALCVVCGSILVLLP
jgi:drug/metabolite transporter (DMT)-like permease